MRLQSLLSMKIILLIFLWLSSCSKTLPSIYKIDGEIDLYELKKVMEKKFLEIESPGAVYGRYKGGSLEILTKLELGHADKKE